MCQSMQCEDWNLNYGNLDTYDVRVFVWDLFLDDPQSKYIRAFWDAKYMRNGRYLDGSYLYTGVHTIQVSFNLYDDAGTGL